MPFAVEPGTTTQPPAPQPVQAEPQKKGSSIFGIGMPKFLDPRPAVEFLAKGANKVFFDPARTAVRSAEADIRGVATAIEEGDIGKGIEESKAIRAGTKPAVVAPVLERGIVGYGREVTAGFAEPTKPVEGADNLAGDISEALGSGAGFVISLMGTQQALGSVRAYSAIERTLLSSPKLRKFAAPLFQNISSFVARGQIDKSALDKDFSERMELAKQDAKTGALFTGLGFGLGTANKFIKNLPIPEFGKNAATALVEYPTMFGVGYTMTDGSKEEKIANGIAFAVLHKVLKLKDEPTVELTPQERIRISRSVEVIRKEWNEALQTRRVTLRNLDRQRPNFEIVTSENANDFGRSVARETGARDRLTFEVSDVKEVTVAQDGKVQLPKGLSNAEMKAAIVDAYTRPGALEGPKGPTISESEARAAQETSKALSTEVLPEAPKPEMVGPAPYLLEPTGEIARQFERDYGIPVFTRFYNEMKEGSISARNLEENVVNLTSEIFGTKNLRNPDLMNRMGLYGNRLQIDKVPRNSARAMEIAKEYGLTPEQKAMYDKWLYSLFPAFKQIADLTGVQIGTREEYGPLIRRELPASEAVMDPESPTGNLKMFAQHMREDKPRNVEDYHTNPLVVSRIYARLLGRAAFLQMPIDNYLAMRDQLPKDVRERFDDFVDANTGRNRNNAPIDRFFENTAQWVDKMTGGKIDIRNVGRMIRDLGFTAFYSNTLGPPKLHLPMLQIVQPYQLGIAEFGPKNFALHMPGAEKDALKPENWKKGREKGWHTQGMPEEFALKMAEFHESGSIRKIAYGIREGLSASLMPIRFLDAHARVRTGLLAERVWDANASKIKNIDEFFRDTGIENMPKSERDSIREAIEAGDLDLARDRHSRFRAEAVNFSMAPGEFGTGRRTGVLSGPIRTFTSFPLQTINAFKNRYNSAQRITFLVTAMGLVAAFKKAGLDEEKQLGPTAAIGGALNIGTAALDTASSMLGGLRAMLGTFAGLSPKEAYDLARQGRSGVGNLIPGKTMLTNWKRLEKSARNDWMLYNSYLQEITQGTPLQAWAQFFGLPINNVDDAYQVRDLSEEQLVVRMKKTDKLRDLILSERFDDAIQYITANPDIANYDIESLFEPLEVRSFKAVPKSQRDEFLKEWAELKAR